MFDAIFGFSSAASPFSQTPGSALAIAPFSMTPDPQLSGFPGASSAPAPSTTSAFPPAPKLDLGSNSPILPKEDTPAPINVTIVPAPPENVGNPDPDLFFFPF